MFHFPRSRVAALLYLASSLLGLSAATESGPRHDGSRLSYLDESEPFYPHLGFPKLTTPQWVGEPGVDGGVIMAIDDMKEVAKYETVLRPILERLKKIDGRAPVSIMCTGLNPLEPQLQQWLQEGLSLEVHT